MSDSSSSNTSWFNTIPLWLRLSGLAVISGGGIAAAAFWWNRRRARTRRTAAVARVQQQPLSGRDQSTPAPSTSPHTISVSTSRRRRHTDHTFLSPPPPSAVRPHPTPSASPRLADIRPTPQSQELSHVLLRAKARKEAREEKQAAGEQINTGARPIRNHTVAASTPIAESTPLVITRLPPPTPATSTSTTAASSSSTSSSTSSTVTTTPLSHSAVVHLSSPARQTVQLNTSPLLLNRRHGVELLCLLVVILVILVFLQDSRYLAPISPILLYSLVSVAHDPVSSDSSASSSLSTPRRGGPLIHSTTGDTTQGLSLFGRSIRLPAPTPRPLSRVPQSASQIPPAKGPTTSAASSSTSSSTNVTLRSPILLSTQPNNSRNNGVAIPFPSLATPIPRSSLLADRERSFTPDTESDSQTSPSARQIQVSTGSSTPVAKDTLSPLTITQQSPIPTDSKLEEQKQPEPIATSPRSVPVESIAASILPRTSSTILPPHPREITTITPSGLTMSAPLIDVSATLARLAPPPSAPIQPPPHLRQPSMDVVETNDTNLDSIVSSMASSSIAPNDPWTALEREFFRPDPAANLPPASITATSFSIRFTFHHSFEDVSQAFLKLGTKSPESSDEAEVSSDCNTPSVLTPSTSSKNLPSATASFLSPIERSGSISSAGSSNVGALFTLSDFVVDVLSDTTVDLAGSSTTSSTTPPPTSIRQLIRRVMTPIKLPQLIRKLLGSLIRISLEERIQFDENSNQMKIQLINRDLSNFFSLWSMQTLKPHPTNPAFTQWSCKYKLTVYNSCGPMRPNVSSWLYSMAKMRQQQVSTLLSKLVKKQVKQQQTEEEEEKQAAALLAATTPTIKQRASSQVRRADSSATRR